MKNSSAFTTDRAALKIANAVLHEASNGWALLNVDNEVALTQSANACAAEAHVDGIETDHWFASALSKFRAANPDFAATRN